MGDSLTVTCNPGYIIPSVQSNFTSVTCIGGEWSGPIECVKIECEYIYLSIKLKKY